MLPSSSCALCIDCLTGLVVVVCGTGTTLVPATAELTRAQLLFPNILFGPLICSSLSALEIAFARLPSFAEVGCVCCCCVVEHCFEKLLLPIRLSYEAALITTTTATTTALVNELLPCARFSTSSRAAAATVALSAYVGVYGLLNCGEKSQCTGKKQSPCITVSPKGKLIFLKRYQK